MVLLILLALTGWCVLPLPLAMALGRSFRQGSQPETRRGPDVRSAFDLAA